MTKKKNKNKVKKAPEVVLSRKAKRKEERKNKKQMKQQFILKRFGKDDKVVNKNKVDPKQELKEQKLKEQEGKKMLLESKRKKLDKKREKERRKRLREENLVEEETLKSMAKKLKMNKKKSDDLDGLDFLMDACDGDFQKSDDEELEEEEKGAKKKKDDDDDEPFGTNNEEDLVDDEDQFGTNSEEDEDHDDDDDDDQFGTNNEEGEDLSDDDDDEQFGTNDHDEDMEEDDGDGEVEEDEEQLGANANEDLGDLDDSLEDENELGANSDSDDDLEEAEGDQSLEDSGKSESKEEEDSSTWEDIYGRTRDKEGNVVTPNAPTKYLPPALRARMAMESSKGGSESEARRQEKLNKLRRKCKGILNRLAAATMSPMVREIEELYSGSGHARADLNECLFGLLSESLLESPAKTPERMLLEHALLVSLLHANIGIEVGATILQSTVEKYREFRQKFDPKSNDNQKQLDNILLFLSHLFTFKVMESQLVFDILNELAGDFSEKDVELIVVVLRGAGFGLRKADPSRLKELILKVQKKSSESKSQSGVNTRIDFMLEVIMAIKNNNVRKIPNYDDSHQQFLLKAMKQWLRPGCQPSPLAVGLKDILDADNRGRWWIVGSAWTGKDSQNAPSHNPSAVDSEPSLSSELMEKARQMRMNTDARKTIFCTLMAAGDYLDAFEKLTKLKVAGKQKEREVAFVIVDTCLQEKSFNPYYAELAVRLCNFERKYMLAIQFSIWDKIKAINDLEKFQCNNLADLTSHLLCQSALPLSSLKVIDWAAMDKTLVQFLRRTFNQPLKTNNFSIFAPLSKSPALSTMREGLRLFLRHFVAKKRPEMKESVFKAEEAMIGSEGKLRL